MKTLLFDRLGDPVRMRHLAEYNVLDPDLHARLDALAERTARTLHAPIALISVVLDTSQLLLGQHGVTGWVNDLRGFPAEWALCAHTVLTGRPYLVSDTTTEPRHTDNPLLSMAGLRSYAGVPLDDDRGQTLGANCVIDTAPRTFTDRDITALTDAATETMHILGDFRTPRLPTRPHPSM